jgi:hypothetical protein
MFVCLSACVTSAPSGQIFVKFYISALLLKSVEKIRVSLERGFLGPFEISRKAPKMIANVSKRLHSAIIWSLLSLTHVSVELFSLNKDLNALHTDIAVRMRWHTRRNQISSLGETDESMWLGRGNSSVDYWQPRCAGQLVAFVLCWRGYVPRSCDACWIPTPFSCCPFTFAPLRRRVQCHINRVLPYTHTTCLIFVLLFLLISLQNTL